MDKILLISASARNGNSKLLLEEIQKNFWLKYSTEVVHIRDYEGGSCLGCDACQESGDCIQQDKIHILMDKVLDASIVVFATPNYFYNVSSLAKKFIDRTYRFYTTKALKGKKFIFLYTGDDTADNIKKYLDNATYGFCVCQEINRLGSFAITTDGIGEYRNPAEKEHVIGSIIRLIASNLD